MGNSQLYKPAWFHKKVLLEYLLICMYIFDEQKLWLSDPKIYKNGRDFANVAPKPSI